MIRFLKVDLDLIEDENLTANELRVYLYLLTKYNTCLLYTSRCV